jgi:hypothetical protein
VESPRIIHLKDKSLNFLLDELEKEGIEIDKERSEHKYYNKTQKKDYTSPLSHIKSYNDIPLEYSLRNNNLEIKIREYDDKEPTHMLIRAFDEKIGPHTRKKGLFAISHITPEI